MSGIIDKDVAQAALNRAATKGLHGSQSDKSGRFLGDVASTGEGTVTLWRPVGPEELALIRVSGMKAFPPRLPDQPIFYPVLTEQYAIKIARDWNVPASGAGYVTRFQVRKAYLDKHAEQLAGGQEHREYWIPASDMQAFNAAITGLIEVTAEFP